ncbi:CPBP family intramembrane glutamic endopeptidase [Alkalihalobacterium bogoriense]|uniref:CPBP family intramembrane glutamic endopeptidase n=1 Tax=Alkalihalobacterium bogoriense TaxID=246272 RepID=UPI00146FB2BA|nr:CPBP family intramembrane glutamic endopeptidase [Alkalihalobacterium bogoriense]
MREFWFIQYLDILDGVPRAIVSAVIKISIWVIPVFIVVKMVEQKNPLSYLGLRDNIGKGLKWAAGGSFLLILYFWGVNLLVFKNNMDFQIGFNELLNTILLVGLIEEIVFRGFILRKLLDSFRFWVANVVTAFLFVSIHFPIWIYNGLFVFPSVLGGIVTAFVLGILFGIIYKKSGSLWSVVIIHSMYNFLVSIFY